MWILPALEIGRWLHDKFVPYVSLSWLLAVLNGFCFLMGERPGQPLTIKFSTKITAFRTYGQVSWDPYGTNEMTKHKIGPLRGLIGNTFWSPIPVYNLQPPKKVRPRFKSLLGSPFLVFFFAHISLRRPGKITDMRRLGKKCGEFMRGATGRAPISVLGGCRRDWWDRTPRVRFDRHGDGL